MRNDASCSVSGSFQQIGALHDNINVIEPECDMRLAVGAGASFSPLSLGMIRGF